MLIFALFSFLLGAALASFLQVLAERLPEGRSIRGRSRCPHCGHDLGWLELIPIVGFFILLGRCRFCKKTIPLKHPLGEIALGFIFLLAFWQTNQEQAFFSLPWIFQLIFWWFVVSVLFSIFFSDLEYYIIPDQIVFAGILVASIFRGLEDLWPQVAFSPILQTDFGPQFLETHFGSALFVAILASLFFAALVVVSRGRWMGLGDAKFAFFLGFALSWPTALLAIFSAFWLGALVGLFLIALGKTSMKGLLPFGTFLSLASLPFLIFGDSITRLFLTFFLGLPQSSFL